MSTTPTRTVERALALLATVCSEESPSLTECARQNSLPASTTLRLLRTLEAADFVSRDEEGAYRAGPHLLQLGARSLAQQEVVQHAGPALARLVAATGESAYLSLRGPGETALYVSALEGTHSVRHTGWAGRTIPLSGSAAGAALTGRVPASGFVILRSAVEPDVTAIAAPVRRPGLVVGALSIVGPDYRLDAETAERHGRLLALEAAAVSASLGTRKSPASERRMVNR